MANTYTQLYIHIVYAVKNRESLITPELETEMYKMLATILNNNGHTTIAIGGMPDHVHIFFGMNPKESLSHLVKEMKTATTAWVNGQNKAQGHFNWQEGYGAFSYSRSQIDAVAGYIRNQKNHHAKSSFRDEYVKLLQSFGIDFDERYVFQWIT